MNNGLKNVEILNAANKKEIIKIQYRLDHKENKTYTLKPSVFIHVATAIKTNSWLSPNVYALFPL